MSASDFLARPGGTGAFCALLDEYARAAAAFCDVLDGFDATRWNEAQPGADANVATPRLVAVHVARAAWGYARNLRTALGLPLVSKPAKLADGEARPAEVRAELVRALRDTEDAAAPLHALSEADVMALRFDVPWGQTYDPEILLEHAIVHLLRHRRQIERW